MAEQARREHDDALAKDRGQAPAVVRREHDGGLAHDLGHAPMARRRPTRRGAER
jgi:hypothetical protein